MTGLVQRGSSFFERNRCSGIQLNRSIGLLRFHLFLYDVTSSAGASDFILTTSVLHSRIYFAFVPLHIYSSLRKYVHLCECIYIYIYKYKYTHEHTHIYIYFTNIELLGVLFIFLWAKHYFFSHTTLKCLILYYKLLCTKLEFFMGVLSSRFSMYLLVWV